jgi:hypothetical protein
MMMTRLKVSREKSPTTNMARSFVVGRLYYAGSPSLAPTILIIKSSSGQSLSLSPAVLNFFANGLLSSSIFISAATTDGSRDP